MNKIFVDLGGETVGILKNYTTDADPGFWHLTALKEGQRDDGAYLPPQHVDVNTTGLKNLYDALKSIYEPTVEG